MKAHPEGASSRFAPEAGGQIFDMPCIPRGNTPGACERRVDEVFDMYCIPRENTFILMSVVLGRGDFVPPAPWGGYEQEGDSPACRLS